MPDTKEDTLKRMDEKVIHPWWQMEKDQLQIHHSNIEVNSQGVSTIDTISSAAPTKKRTDDEPKDPPPVPKQPKYYDIIDWGKKIWIYFFPKSAAAVETTAASYKPADDPITGLGSPTLELPYQIDLKELEQLLKELKDLNHQIQEMNNESEEDLKKERSFESLRGLIEYFKEQKKLHEVVTADRKWEIIFCRKQDKEIRKEQGNWEQLKIEADESTRFWTDVNWYLSCASMTGTAILVGFVAYTTLGGGAIVIPAVLQIGMNVSKCAIDLTTGGTMLMKSILEKKVGGMKETIENLNARHLKVTFITKMQVDQMNMGWNTAEKLTKEMMDLLRNYREAVQNINAR